MAAANTAPGAFLSGVQDEPHSDSLIGNDTLELFYDTSSGAVAARGNSNGTNYTASMVPSSGTTYVTATADELNTLDGVLATTAELNRAADVSTRLIAAGGTLAATVAAHSDKIILLDTAAGSIVTLPAAAGTGALIRCLVSVLATADSHIIKVNATPGTDLIQGTIHTVDSDTAGTVRSWMTAADTDTITLNRSTTGSVTRGEWIELVDAASGLWLVRGTVAGTGDGATPFSAAVP